MKLSNLTSVPSNFFSGKRIIVRVDFNVPLQNGEVRDAYRINESIATINFLRESGAKIVLISHIGKGGPTDTLLPIANYLSSVFFPVTFLRNLRSEENVRVIEKLQSGDVVLLENLRHDKGEESNDPAFVAYLASLGDVYVNDAFSVSHRPHASVVGLPLHLPHFAGMRLSEEIERLSVAFTPEHPFLFILGGAKISTKMPLLKKFLNIADQVFVGGAIANNFLKVGGHEIGTSLFDRDELSGLESHLSDPKLLLPIDVIVKNSAGSESRLLDGVTATDMIVDVGMSTVRNIEASIGKAKLIIWNGPLGFYEEGFTEGTRELLNLIAGSQAISIIGGGDTVALINEMGALEKFTFVSTGGGAMLDYLANETLPGIEALQH